MDVTTIAAFLSPLLPYLIKSSEETAKEIGKKFGDEVWERAKALWVKLWPKIESEPVTKSFIQNIASDLEKNPTDEAAKSALLYQLKTLINNDSALEKEIKYLWEETKTTEGVSNVIASGERSVAFGGDAVGSNITTGDQETKKP